MKRILFILLTGVFLTSVAASETSCHSCSGESVDSNTYLTQMDADNSEPKDSQSDDSHHTCIGCSHLPFLLIEANGSNVLLDSSTKHIWQSQMKSPPFLDGVLQPPRLRPESSHILI